MTGNQERGKFDKNNGAPPERRLRKERPFPEDPIERAGLLLASFNASPKAADQMILTPSTTSTADVNRRFRELYAGTDFGDNLRNREMGTEYLRATLYPIGLVAEEISINYFGVSKITGYSLTDAGIQYGQPGAAKFLEFETEEGFSLYPIFGKTGTSSPDEIRTPLIRAKILMSLLGRKQRVIDLAKVVGMHQTQLHPTLNLLRNAEVITYDSINFKTGRQQLTYELTPTFEGDILPVNHNKEFTTMLIHICTQLTRNGIPLTQQNIFEQLPPEVAERWKRKDLLKARISQILLGLSQQGYLQRLKFKSGEFSSVDLTDKGAIVVTKLLHPLLDAMQDGETLTQWRADILPRVSANLDTYVKTTANLYYPYSKSAKLQKHVEYVSGIEALLGGQAEREKGMTVSEIAATLGIHRRTVAHYLDELKALGKIKETQDKATRYFSLNR